MNEGFIKKPIETRKPDTNIREAKTEAEAGRKNITKPKPKPNPSKTTFDEAEAEAEANKFRMLGSRSGPGSQHFREKPGFWKSKPKPASSPTLVDTSTTTIAFVTWSVIWKLENCSCG